jgi:DNA-binding beta-propeller fold protein YncE
MSPARSSLHRLAPVIVAISLVLTGEQPMRWLSSTDRAPGRAGTLVAYEPLSSDICVMPSAEVRTAMRQEYVRMQSGRGQSGRVPGGGDAPVRTIKDPYPSFAGVSVDPVRNEVVFTDESLFQVLVYDRMENTPAGAAASKPKRVIVGEKTNIEFQSSAWVDPKTGEIYAVNNDTRDTTVVFGAGANGNAAPVRSIHTPHGSFGIAAAEEHDEVLMTIQHDSAIVAYKKSAGENDSPIRMMQGLATKLADPHGIAYDPKEDVIFVANFGATHDVAPGKTGRDRRGRGRTNWPLGRDLAVPGSGTISKPSISVHRRLATGNEPPLRVIEGPAAQLNWPTGLAFDPGSRELFVANDMGPSIVVFDAAAQGNVAPKRVLKGSRTALANPTAVSLDLKNSELWVANFGGHSGLAFDLKASGNAAPKRTIRNAPPNAPSLMIGNPGAVGYDTKRENILVPN